MADTLFTQIINGDIPSHKLYEDEKTYAFLDINPVQPGHALVIPKTPVETIWELNEEDYHAVMATAKKLAVRIKQVLGVPYVGVKVEGLQVPHAHVHLIPFTTSEEYTAHPSATVDHEALAALAKKLSI